VVVQELGIVGVLYGQIIGATAQFVTLLITEWKWSFFSFSMPYLRDMLYFSIFLIPTQLASFVTYWSNRYFLQEHASLDDVGVFSLGYKIASVIPILITGPIKKAIGPEVYSLIDNQELCKSKIRHFTSVILVFLTLFALSLSMFSRELVMIVATKAYSSSYEVVFILSMGYVLIGIASIVVLPINISKKTWLITLTWILGSGVNLVLNFYLVSLYGKAGATYATFITFLFILTLYFIFSEKVYHVGFEYKKYLSLIILVTIVYFFSSLIQVESIVIVILIKVIMLATTGVAVVRFFLNKKEKGYVLRIMNKLIPIKKYFSKSNL